jgi:hypothetical protein
MPRGKYVNHKGKNRRFNNPEEINEQMEKEKLKREWREKHGDDPSEESGEEKGSSGSSSEEDSSDDEGEKAKGVQHLIQVIIAACYILALSITKIPNQIMPKLTLNYWTDPSSWFDSRNHKSGIFSALLSSAISCAPAILHSLLFNSNHLVSRPCKFCFHMYALRGQLIVLLSLYVVNYKHCNADATTKHSARVA